MNIQLNVPLQTDLGIILVTKVLNGDTVKYRFNICGDIATINAITVRKHGAIKALDHLRRRAYRENNQIQYKKYEKMVSILLGLQEVAA